MEAKDHHLLDVDGERVVENSFKIMFTSAI